MSGVRPIPTSPKVLVVEDELVVAMDLERSLASLGYEVAGVTDNAPEAVRLAKDLRPDLVLMDVRLRGEMDGIEAAGEIRRACQVPVVYTTAYTNDETIERARGSGAFGILVKPYQTKELNATIAMALTQHRLSQEVLASRAWLRAILDHLTDAVIATGARGHIRFLNPAAQRLLGWNEVEAVGRPIEEVFQPLDADREPVHELLVRRAMRGGEVQPKVRRIVVARDGKEVPVEVSAQHIADDHGTVIGAVTVITDVSDRVERERAMAAEREQLQARVRWTQGALDETRKELRVLAANVMSAQEEEGRRIAAELHDDFSQRLALLELEADRLRADPSPERVGLALERIGTRAAELSNDLRMLSHRLHPSVLENLGLTEALRGLVEESRAAGLEAAFTDRGVTEPVPGPIATTLYRIAQEALRNVSKHAPGAKVSVELSQEKGEVRLLVEDDGPGFDVTAFRSRSGMGLLSMQERARLAGGSLLVNSRPGQGTALLVRLPRAAAA